MSRHFEPWRAALATWGGAAWLVLRQFGVPAAGPVERDSSIVLVEYADECQRELETLPENQILTLPAEPMLKGSRSPEFSAGRVRWGMN